MAGWRAMPPDHDQARAWRPVVQPMPGGCSIFAAGLDYAPVKRL